MSCVLCLPKRSVEFAEGEAGGFVFDLGDELGGDGGNERIGSAAGESLDFLVGGGDGDLFVELEAEEAGVPSFEGFFEAGGGGDAEGAFEGEVEEAFVGAGGDGFAELGFEVIEAGVIGEAEGELLPAEAGGGDLFDGGRLAGGEGDLEDVAGFVGEACGETVDFRSAGIPRGWGNFLGSVPVTEGDVSEVFRETAEVDPVGDAGFAGVFVLGGAEALDGAVSEDDSGEFGREIGESSSADPSGGIAGIAAAEERRGEDDGGSQDDRFGGEEDAEVWGKVLLFLAEKLLFPDAAGAAVVMISRDGEDWDFQCADDGASGGDGGFGGLGGIEQVAGDEDESGAGSFRERAEAADGVEALLLKAVAFWFVADGGKGFAELPVGGVEENEAHLAGK